MIIIPIPACTATRECNVVKEHTCIRCGVVYRYVFQRAKARSRFSPRAAESAAEWAVIKAMDTEADRQPCPGCGLYQPDMIAATPARWHWYLVGLTAAFLFVVGLFSLFDVIQPGAAAWSAVVGAGLFLVGHLLVDCYNPNANLATNMRLARYRVGRDELWPVPSKGAGWSEIRKVGRHRFGARLGVYALLALSLLAFACPELVLLANDWPTNPQCRPVVVGPGDTPGVYIPKDIDCIKGLWRGTATAEVLNYKELGLSEARLRAESNKSRWGEKISRQSGDTNGLPRLWVMIYLPDDANLVGKALVLQINMKVLYPKQQGQGYVNVEETVVHDTTIELAPVGAGNRYRTLWWAGMLVGSLLLLVSGALLALLAASFRRRALPARVIEHPFLDSKLDEEERPARPGDEIRLPQPPWYRDDS
jgi:hypothetical protein